MRETRKLRSRLAFVVAAVAAMSITAPAHAETVVSWGWAYSNVTWTEAGSPYILESDYYIAEGYTLTIEPGVIVKFEHQDGRLGVHGTISAVGTAEDRITFTSIDDDSVGGDSGDDGPTTGTAGDWSHIEVRSATANELEYVDVKYGGVGFAHYTGGAVVCGNVCTLSIDHSTFTNNQTAGLRVGGGAASGPWPTATVYHSSFSSNELVGIAVNLGRIVLDNDNLVTLNGTAGIYISLTGWYDGLPSTIDHSTITENGTDGIQYMPGSGVAGTSIEPTGYGNNIYDNGEDQLYNLFDSPQLDWSGNYWGETSRYVNPAPCLVHYPGHYNHIYYDGVGYLSGPISHTVRIVVVNDRQYLCILDNVEGHPAEDSLIDNSGL